MSRFKSLRDRVLEAERKAAVKFLNKADGNVNQAARLSGVHPFQFRRIIQRHSLQALIKRHTGEGRARGGNEAWHALDEVHA